jgi:hypothetical protein
MRIDDIADKLMKLKKELGPEDALDVHSKEILRKVNEEIECIRKYVPPNHPLRCPKCQAKGRRNMCPENHFPKDKP